MFGCSRLSKITINEIRKNTHSEPTLEIVANCLTLDTPANSAPIIPINQSARLGLLLDLLIDASFLGKKNRLDSLTS